MENKRLSIVITVYNKAIYLGHCFNLLREQLLKINEEERNKIEIIVIDDCSTDSSIYNINEIMDGLEYKVITNMERKNIAYVRFQAVNEVKGKYFIFIDADDLITEDYLETVLGTTQKETGYDLYQYLGREYPNGCLMDFDSTWMPIKLFRTAFLRNNNINFNSTFLNEAGQCTGEDKEFFDRFLTYKPTIHNVEKVIVTWNFAVPKSLTKMGFDFSHLIPKD